MKADKIYKKLGIEFPADLSKLLKSESPGLEEFAVASLTDVAKLGSLDPSVPLRLVPFMENASGDLYGVYYPRDGGNPFAVCFELAQSAVLPLTNDFSVFAQSLVAMATWNREQIEAMRTEGIQGWQRLLVDPDSMSPHTEILKPMSLNRFALQYSLELTFSKIVKRLSNVDANRGWNFFKDPIDLLRFERWRAFARSRLEEGFPAEALQALENAHVTLFITLQNGFPGESGNVDNFALAKDVFEEMRRLIAKWGADKLDEAVVAFQCKNYDRWMEDDF